MEAGDGQCGERWEQVGERFQHDMAQAGTGVNDPRRLMREATQQVAALQDASANWSGALTAAGLPARMWESNAAYFRHLSPSLPGMSLGAFVARLDRFAGHEGPAWLAGGERDLRAFHEEVMALDTLARALRSAVHQIHKPTIGNRSEPPLSRALSQPRASAALDDLVAILGRLLALAPLLKPLPREPAAEPSALEPFALEPAALQRADDGPATVPLSPSADQPPTRVARVAALLGGIAPGQRLAALRAGVAAPLRPLAARWRGSPGNRRLAVMAGILLVMATITVALTLARRPHAPVTTAPTAATAGSSPSPRATLTATATSSAPAATLTPQPTAAPAPKLALACVVRGTTATLTITNSGSTPLTWEAKAQASLTVSPTRGTLASGQSATARVTADHKKSPTGSITVTATSEGGASTSSSVACK